MLQEQPDLIPALVTETRSSQTIQRMKPATRANFLPEPRFVPLRPALQEHLAKLGAAISPANFLSICDEMLLKLLKETFARIGADEGSIWLLDQEKHHFRCRLQQRPGHRQDHGVQAASYWRHHKFSRGQRA